MKRDPNTFIQTHWNNRGKQRKSSHSRSIKNVRAKSPKHYDYDHAEENIEHRRNESQKNKIYTPSIEGEKAIRPVISPPPDLFDKEVKEITHQNVEEKSKYDRSEEMRKRKSSINSKKNTK
ncbi:hypothetical protein, partial [Halobacillus sp. BBL2006]|uniref:hypothetical protein n=1 Tax=Halobacillus sp. BBL2006 TaxID=1543706 RepID=UPI00054223E0